MDEEEGWLFPGKDGSIYMTANQWVSDPWKHRKPHVLHSFSPTFMAGIIMCLSDDKTRRLSNLLKGTKKRGGKARILI